MALCVHFVIERNKPDFSEKIHLLNNTGGETEFYRISVTSEVAT
jgi:hypothetical protein